MAAVPVQSANRSPRLPAISLLCLAVTALVLALDYAGFNPLWRAELYSEDFRVRHARPAPLDPRIVFLAVDQPDYQPLLKPEETAAAPILEKMAGWPWDRSVHAAILERLAGAGAKAVVFDFFFLNPGHGDEALRAAIARHRDRVVVAAMVSKEDRQGTLPEQLFVPNPLFDDAVKEAQAANADGCVGFANFSADADGKVRRAQFRRNVGGLDAESLAARALRKAGLEGSLRGHASERLRFAGKPGNNYAPIPVFKLFLPRSWSAEFQDGGLFRDKIVFIGPYGEWSKDLVPTPYLTPMPGPELHLAALGGALSGVLLRELSPAAQALFIVLGGLGAWLLSLRRTHPGWLLPLLAALASGWWVIAFILFDRTGWILPMVAPVVAFVLARLACFVHDFLLERQEKKRIRLMFSTMVSPAVLTYMQEHPERFRLTGERRQATLFFSDLAGFTTISESLTPDDLARVLNRYLTPMSDLILRHGGYIDKYEGDAIMADFGVPVWNDPDATSHAWHACWAALENMETLRQLQPQFKADYGVDIDVRIGINTGWVSAGNMGSEQKFQYTVMGDAVNQAARFEPANKLFGTRILIGEPTYELARDKIEARLVAALVVKGKTQPVNCYELLARKGELPESKRRVVELFEQGWRLHAERRFADALTRFEQVLAIDPEDGPSQTYKRVCAESALAPPPAGWKGEFVQTSK